MTIRTPSLASVLSAVRTQAFADLHVALPGRVERYDSETQRADVQPLLKETFTAEDGSREIVSLPVVTEVPVIFPGGGGFRVTFPLAVGDTVLLVFADRALDTWASSGHEGTPEDDRRHHLTDAVAIPGLHSNAAPWSGAEAGVVTIGSDSGAAEFAATAQRVLTELQKIESAFNTHTHVITTAPGTSAPPLPQVTGLTSPASSTVKIKG